jgi:hypothetical protein
MESQVNEVKVDKHTQLSDTFFGLSEQQRLSIRLEICDRLGIGTSTFYNRLRGYKLMKKSEIPIIEDVFRTRGIEVFKP